MGDLPKGVWPVMLTPFTVEGAIDWDGVDVLTDWYIDSGVAGLFAVCLSSEMYELTDGERLALAKRVAKRVDGRVPVMASGTFPGATENQAAFVKEMADTGVDGVIAIVCQLAGQGDSDEVWKANAERLLEQTRDVPMGLYECPSPYHRLLSPELMGWCGSTGRFRFIKETSAGMEQKTPKLEALQGSPLGFYNAGAATLLASLKQGGDGYCGTGANFFPDLFVWLCSYFEAEPEMAADLQRFLSIAQMVVKNKYKTSAKRYLAMQGMPIQPVCRDQEVTFREDELATLTHMSELVEIQRKERSILVPEF